MSTYVVCRNRLFEVTLKSWPWPVLRPAWYKKIQSCLSRAWHSFLKKSSTDYRGERHIDKHNWSETNVLRYYDYYLVVMSLPCVIRSNHVVIAFRLIESRSRTFCWTGLLSKCVFESCLICLHVKDDISYINTPSHEGRRDVSMQQHVACDCFGMSVRYRERMDRWWDGEWCFVK